MECIDIGFACLILLMFAVAYITIVTTWHSEHVMLDVETCIYMHVQDMALLQYLRNGMWNIVERHAETCSAEHVAVYVDKVKTYGVDPRKCGT